MMMIAYRRLAPMAQVDALMVVTGTSEPLELQLPVFPCRDDEHDMSHADKRAALQRAHELVFTHMMFPVIPRGITATRLPAAIWATSTSREELRALWCRHLMSDHYAPYEDTRTPLELHGEAHVTHGLGMFGASINPLDSVVAFSVSIKDTSMLLHYVFVVALQYYLIKRRCLVRVRTDRDAQHFSDALPPFVFALFRQSDCRMPKGKRALAATALYPPVTHENAELYATTLSFPTFLLLVFRWMQAVYPSTAAQKRPVASAAADLKHNAQDAPLEFCKTKLSKNWIQSLTCMRFREFSPDGFCERVGESRGGTSDVTPSLKRSKFFQHPNACQLLSLNAASVKPTAVLERIPYFFTHNAFRPDQPIMRETPEDVSESVPLIERQRLLIFRLLQFSPLLSFLKHIHPKVTQEWSAMAGSNAGRVFPTDSMSKWQEYDAYVRATRANYSFYVPLSNRGSQAFAMVTNLHLSPNVPVPDNDTDMRSMSQEAFDWCCAHGTAFACAADALAVATSLGRVRVGGDGMPLGGGYCTAGAGWNEFFAWVVREELSKAPDDARHPYTFMLAVQLLTGREEDGVATAARLFTYEQMQDAYAEMTFNALHATDQMARGEGVQDASLLAEIVAGRLAWDRCTPLPFPVHKLQHSIARDRMWYFHFPDSHVRLRGADGVDRPWVDCFRMRDRLAHTKRQLRQVAALFDTAVLEELASAVNSSSFVIDEATRQQLRSIYTYFVPAHTVAARAMRSMCLFASSNGDAERAAAQSREAIALAPVAFRNDMEIARRLIHFDLIKYKCAIRAATLDEAERHLVRVIGDPQMVVNAMDTICVPYQQLFAAADEPAHDADEAYAAAQLQ